MLLIRLKSMLKSFLEVNKYETFIRPTCFTQEKLILLRGRLRSML